MQESNIILQGVTFNNLVSAIADEVIKRLSIQATITEKNLTTYEVCKLLNVTRQTLSRWEKQGVLIPNRIGRKVLYNEIDVKKNIGRVK